MRKIIISAFMTVDGLISSPDNEMTWIKELFDDEMVRDLGKQLSNADTFIFGRITYETIKEYCHDPALIKKATTILDHFHQTRKFVFSRTLQQLDWNNATIVKELDRKTIRSWQQQSGGDITVIGSASIAQLLINLELVNEFHFFVHPLMLGKGKPLFRDIREQHALTPIRTDLYKNGILRLCYQAFTD